jgi:hypothetical protein
MVTVVVLVLSACSGVARGYDGSISGSVSGGSAYYKVGGWTDYAYFRIDFSAAYNLQLRLYTDEGDLVATGTSPSSTAREIVEYLSGGDIVFVVITLVSGTGPASFTLTYQDIYTISYHGTVAPFTTGDDQLTALAVGAPIILGLGFAIIGIFGRMKPRSRKGEHLYAVAPPAIKKAPPGPAKRFCTYCGSVVSPGNLACIKCGKLLK